VKRVRVGYTVTAQDDVEGALPVTCQPKSRSWFKVGRTQVRCSATDTSANESKVGFVITVKRRR
jgi:HYR domain